MVTAGKTLFDTKCGRCHALKEPATFTPDKWVPIIDRMAVKAKLVEDEKKQVLAYVQYYAKK
jgi:cytochrome c2